MHRPSRGGNSGRFIDPLLNTGCTPLLRATMTSDTEVMQALLDKGASPNVNDMGLTPFLVAAGVGSGRRGGTGLAAAAAQGRGEFPLMDLLLQHGADVNAQVTGTKTYSMRIARSPSSNEGMTALHAAAQAGRADVVRYLLEKGRQPRDRRWQRQQADRSDRDRWTKWRSPAPPASSGWRLGRARRSGCNSCCWSGSRGGAAGGGVSPAAIAEIRDMLQNAASKK